MPATKVSARSGEIFTYLVPAKLHGVLRPGVVVRVPFGGREILGVVSSQEMHRLAQDTQRLKEITDVAASIPPFDEKRLALMKWMADYYWAPLGMVIKAMLPHETKRPSAQDLIGQERKNPDYVLTEAQRGAVAQIGASIEKNASFFLSGPPGSGKTEVCLMLISRVLSAGKQILVLVPEIYDAETLIPEFARRFGVENLVLLHSKISYGQRAEAGRAIARGEKKIIIATRSGVLLPFASLGFIVIERAHSDAYVEQQLPRYDARTAARELARLWSCPVVAADLMPDLASYFAAKEKEMTLLALPHPVKADRQAPSIKIANVSTSESRQFGKMLGVELEYALEENVRAKRQSVLILNRRGGGTLLCPDCGYAPKCPTCAIPLTWQESIKKLVCSQCGRTQEPETKCPSCGSAGLRLLKYGTQALEAEVNLVLKKIDPANGLLVARLDADTALDQAEASRIERDFKNGKISVLVGTQLITARYGTKNLSLVGVISADTFLTAPNYKALEDAYADFEDMVRLVASAALPSTILLQTFRPDHPLFGYLKNSDYSAFYEAELLERKKFGYPPFTRLLRLTFDGRNPQADATKAVEALRGILPPSVDIIGPAAARGAPDKSAKWEILIKLPRHAKIDATALHRAVGNADLDPHPEVKW